MLTQIKGLHHVTSMAADARQNNDFFTHKLGLRRVKQTVNFDAPDVYHLYYADEFGTPGSVMTYFRSRTSVPAGTALAKSAPRLSRCRRARFPSGKALFGTWRDRGRTRGKVWRETAQILWSRRRRVCAGRGQGRQPCTLAEGWCPGDEAIRGFHSVSLRLKDGGATEELLKFMGYQEVDRSGNISRLAVKNGNGADVVDIESLPGASFAGLGAGSVHHVAFAVENRAKQLEVRKALMDTGYQVTPVIDRDYFWAIYSARRVACCSKWRPTSRASTGMRIRPILAKR